MSSNDSVLVAIHPPGDQRSIAEVSISALHDIHHSAGDPSDDVLYAYVAPAEVIVGDLSFAREGDRHAQVLVCVPQTFNTRASYARLIEFADSNTATPTESAGRLL